MTAACFEQRRGGERPVAARKRAGPGPANSLVGPAGVLDARTILSLQRSAGNAAVAGLLQRPNRDLQRQDQSGSQPPPGSASPSLHPASWLAPDPADFFRLAPSLAQPRFLSPVPAPTVLNLIDWGALSATFRTRQLTLGDGDRSVIIDHWQRWYPVSQALYGLPLARTFFSSPADIMNTLTAKMIDTSLAGDHPDPKEIFNREGERFGVSTHAASVTVAHF